MIRSVFKLALLIAFVFIGVVAYQTEGVVNIRVAHWSISMSFGTFVISALVGVLFILYTFIFFRYLSSLSSRLKTYWLKRHELEGQKYLEESLSDLEDGKLDSANKKARKSMQLLPDLLIPKWLMLTVMKSRGISLDGNLVTELIKSKSMGLLGYRYLIEQRIQDMGAGVVEADLSDALQRYPTSKWLLTKLFEVQVRDNNYLAAIKTGTKLQSMYSTGISRKLALCYYSLSQQTETSLCLKHLKSAYALDPANILIATALASLHIEQGNIKKAHATIESTWKYCQSKELAQLYLSTADQSSSEGRIKLALKLSKLSEDTPFTYLTLIEEYLRVELYAKARHHLEKAIQKNGGMSYELLRLRVELSEKDRAEQPNFITWTKEIAHNVQYVGWKCHHCGTKPSTWEEICKNCGSLHKVTWVDEHKGVTSLSTIKEGS